MGVRPALQELKAELVPLQCPKLHDPHPEGDGRVPKLPRRCSAR